MHLSITNKIEIKKDKYKPTGDNLEVPWLSVLLETLSAVDGPVAAGLEWYFTFFAAV